MNKKEEFPVEVVMLTYSIIMLMYVFTYGQKSYLFWAFFVIERLMTISYEDHMEEYLLGQDIEEISVFKISTVAVFLLICLGVFIYALIKAPKLCLLLFLGEIIDVITKMVKDKFVN